MRSVGVPFTQQYKIGEYKVDFFILPNIVVEVEGICHENSLIDAARTKYLTDCDCEVYRIPCSHIRKDAKAVAELIKSFTINSRRNSL